jgi:hypothetical protein
MGGQMKNTWLDEIHIRSVAEKISKCLRAAFVGRKENVDEWTLQSSYIIIMQKTRIRDSLMQKYGFEYELDEQDHVQCLKYIRLPWFI